MKPFKKNKYIIIILIVLCLIFTISCSSTATTTTAAKITTTQIPTTTTSAPTTTVEQTTTTQEATTTTEAIINAPEIAGLKFDQATKTYIAEAANPYGLKEGELAGIYTKEAIKVNGEMEDAIGLKPTVIDYFQKQYIKNNDLFFPLMINLNESQGVELTLVYGPDKYNYIWFGSNVPVGTKLYTPYTTKLAFYTDIPGGYFDLNFCSEMANKKRGPATVLQSRTQFARVYGKKKGKVTSPNSINFELEIGELIAEIDKKIPFSSPSIEGKYDFLFDVVKDKFMLFENKKIYVLPDESTSNAQN